MKTKIIVLSIILLSFIAFAFTVYKVEEDYISSCGAHWHITVYITDFDQANFSLSNMERRSDQMCGTNATIVTQPSVM